jgi:glycosyltransferase involved in cell wall biosynthesis
MKTSERKKKILILLSTQFGYHTDTYMYCKYLDKTQFDVTYFCFDYQYPKVENNGINVIYIEHQKNKIIRNYSYIQKFNKVIKNEQPDLIFQVYVKLSLLIRLLNLKQPLILDIRTGDLSDNDFIRWIRNYKIKFTTFFYRRISIISPTLLEVLGINKKKSCILPLGGELLNTEPLSFKALRLLYVGTLEKRNIHETVLGVSKFVKQNPHIDISYDIIGYGSESTEKLLYSTILDNNLQDVVFFQGKKLYHELPYYFGKCNIGVVYLPQTKAYDCQPTTKLYEYILSGMPVIATNTTENRNVISPENGIICEDNPDSFYEALKKIVKNSDEYSSEKIKNSVINNSWENIVKNILSPLFLEEI